MDRLPPQAAFEYLKGEKPQMKTERLHLRISPELKEKLQAAAEAENRTVSNYVEKLLKEAVKEKAK